MSIREIQNKGPATYEALACCVSGKKIRKRFKTKGAAEQWTRAKRRERDRDRYQVLMIPDGLRPELVKAQEILEPFAMSILGAAEYYATHHINGAAARRLWTFSEASRACLEHRIDAGVRPYHLADLRSFFERASLCFGDRNCDDISTENLVYWVRGLGI